MWAARFARIIAPSVPDEVRLTYTLLALLGLLNLGVLLAVLLRRFLKHWYFLAQDAQRLEVAAYLERALDVLQQGRALAAPRQRRLAESELLRRVPGAVPTERQLLQRIYRQWGFVDYRRARLRRGGRWERAYSAQALGRVEARDALADILPLLAAPARELRLAALRALEMLGEPEAIAPLVKVLPELGRTARGMVWAALIASGRREPERLLEHLDHPAPRVRAVVAAALAEVGSPVVLEQLLAYTEEPEPEVRVELARALGRSGSPRALAVLARWAQDEAWEVRLQAVGALGALGDRNAHDSLVRATHDSHLFVRQQAAAALYRLWGDPIALIELLGEAPADRSGLVALVSELESVGVTWDAINQVTAPEPTLRQQSRELLRRLIGVGAYTAVFYAIEMHSDPEVRAALVELVAQALPAEGYLDLVGVLASPYLDARTRSVVKKLVGFPAEIDRDLG